MLQSNRRLSQVHPSLRLGSLAAAAAALALSCATARAVTLSEYGHNLKEDAASAGHAVVRVGSETGHGVVHAAKTVGGDISQGASKGYHATKRALSGSKTQPAAKASGTR